MAATTNHWKLGLFVVLGVLVAFGALVVYGVSKFDKVVLPFVTYFDESVQGLEVGSPVKFRGVTMGTVKRISVAPDRRHVEVMCVVDVEALTRLGLRPEDAPLEQDEEEGQFVPPDLRIQLVSSGITGVKFLQADFFEIEKHPPPGLPFPTPPNYVPAIESSLKSLEDSIVGTLNKFPALVDKGQDVLIKVEEFLDQFDAQKFSDEGVAALENVNGVLTELRAELNAEEVAKLRDQLGVTLKSIDDAAQRFDGLMVRLEKEDGTIDNLESTLETIDEEITGLELQETVDQLQGAIATVDSTTRVIGDLARDADGLTDELEHTMRSLREAAASLKSLTDALEKDSDMLLKGRATGDR